MSSVVSIFFCEWSLSYTFIRLFLWMQLTVFILLWSLGKSPVVYAQMDEPCLFWQESCCIRLFLVHDVTRSHESRDILKSVTRLIHVVCCHSYKSTMAITWSLSVDYTACSFFLFIHFWKHILKIGYATRLRLDRGVVQVAIGWLWLLGSFQI